MAIDIKYRAAATASGGRTGTVATDDGALSLKLVTPQELGGAGGEGTNPEQLFAAGYSACFLSALHLVGKQQKIAVPADATIAAEVAIGPNASGGFGLVVELLATLPGVDRSAAEQLVQAAHHVCPYSNAIRGNVEVALRIA